MSEFLAKSKPPVTLWKHITDGLVIRAALRPLLPQLVSVSGFRRFWEMLEICIIFHDLGKAHPAFQRKIHGENRSKWGGRRHELFSLPFLSALDWDPEEKQLMEWVVAGHHRTFQELKQNLDENFRPSGSFETDFSSLPIEDVLQLLRRFNQTPGPLSPENPKHILKRFDEFVLNKKIEDLLPLLLLAGAFQQCDHLSSGFVEKLEKLEDTNFEFLDEKRKKLLEKDTDFYGHQLAARDTDGSIIVTSPTGSGKTETAMLWLRRQLATRGQGRVFYILPFTASINAMHRRWSEALGEETTGMLHGKLDAFLYELFREEGVGEEQAERIKKVKQQFKTLQTPVRIVTPFQLLRHLFRLKGYEKGMVEWVGGYFIFDEIHAYDPGVFAQIQTLIEYISRNLGGRFCLMTATLPSFMKKKLKEAIGEVTEISAEPALYETFKRHRLALRDGLLTDHLTEIAGDLSSGKRVLVVCNTIDQAQEVYRCLKDAAETSLLLHGSFNGEDRNRKETLLKTEETWPQLLVGTQAIEVSLDIDYEVIYTEPAPLDALLQRFGRVNRRRRTQTGKCVVFRQANPKDRFIYRPERISRTMEVLEAISAKEEGVIDEAELQLFIDAVYPGFDTEEQREYQEIIDELGHSLIQMIPFSHSDQQEEDFYKQFDGVKVLPELLFSTYVERINAFDFIGAELLKVQIRRGAYTRYRNEGIVTSVSVGPANGRVSNAVYLIQLSYSEELGLLKDQRTDAGADDAFL